MKKCMHDILLKYFQYLSNDSITKKKNIHGKRKRRRKYMKYNFCITHYNDKKIEYTCNNMIFDNIKDIYIFKDIIDIIENSDMLFFKKYVF